MTRGEKTSRTPSPCSPPPATTEQQLELAELLGLAGSTALAQHRLDDAAGHYAAELALREQTADRKNLALVYNQLGVIAQRQHRLAAAEVSYRTAASIWLELAFVLFGHAAQLAEAGKLAEALQTSTEAVALRRELADQARDAYLPDLAISLHNHALLLSNSGRGEESGAASREALGIYRELTAADRDKYLPDLAGILLIRAAWLVSDQQATGAVRLSAESAGLYRQLTGRDRDRYLTKLADALRLHAGWLCEAGQGPDVVSVSEEIVTLRRELAVRDSDVHAPALADALCGHGRLLAALGRASEAIPPQLEATGIYSQMDRDLLDTLLPDVVPCLADLARFYIADGNLADSLGFSTLAMKLGARLPQHLWKRATPAALAVRQAYQSDPAGAEEIYRKLTGDTFPSWLK